MILSYWSNRGKWISISGFLDGTRFLPDDKKRDRVKLDDDGCIRSVFSGYAIGYRWKLEPENILPAHYGAKK